MLKKDLNAWNEWKEVNSETFPDLSAADLTRVSLVGANLRGADLREADLRGADLHGADLSAVSYTHLTLPTNREV